MTMTDRPTVTGALTCSRTMSCEPMSVGSARRLVTAALRAWGLGNLAHSGALIVSELAGNAVAHSRSSHFRVTVSRPEPNRVRIAVIDKCRTHPAPRTAYENEESGRGLAVVEALADRWDTDALAWGKRVWADLCTEDGQ